MLTVNTDVRDGYVVVQLEGRLDGSPACSQISEHVKARLGEGHRHFVVDLAEVEWMSSCGIGCLIAAYSSVRRAEGSLALKSPNQRVLGALRITDLVPSVFEVLGVHDPAHPATH